MPLMSFVNRSLDSDMGLLRVLMSFGDSIERWIHEVTDPVQISPSVLDARR